LVGSTIFIGGCHTSAWMISTKREDCLMTHLMISGETRLGDRKSR
jgi:hypothetical protein